MSQLVSVIIPCYNHAKYLPFAVASILNQTYENWECIIVNDGSPDNTRQVAQELTKKDSRIVSFFKENGGLSSARNYGINKAKGKYIVTLDADDTFENTFIEKSADILQENNSIGVVSCYGYRFIDKTKLSLFKPAGGRVENFLFFSSALASAMFRKKCWIEAGGYDETMKRGYEDWEFYIRVTKLGYQVEIIKEPLFNYRQHKTSMLKEAQKTSDLENKKYIYTKHKEIYKSNFDLTINKLLEVADKNKKQELKRLESIDYKLGEFLLKPVRFLKRFFYVKKT